MNASGITGRIINFCNALLGHIRGGLGLANVGASMLFGGISGTAIADTASIGSVMIPAMKKKAMMCLFPVPSRLLLPQLGLLFLPVYR